MIIKGLASGELKSSKKLIERLNKCTLCMTFTANCPVKAKVTEAIVAVKADIFEIRSVATRVGRVVPMFRTMVSHSRAFSGTSHLQKEVFLAGISQKFYEFKFSNILAHLFGAVSFTTVKISEQLTLTFSLSNNMECLSDRVEYQL